LICLSLVPLCLGVSKKELLAWPSHLASCSGWAISDAFADCAGFSCGTGSTVADDLDDHPTELARAARFVLTPSFTTDCWKRTCGPLTGSRSLILVVLWGGVTNLRLTGPASPTKSRERQDVLSHA
jgi:hypothetical protein